MEGAVSSVARRWLLARERCDLAALAELTAEDARWESPIVREVEGREAVVEQIRSGFVDADDFATELLSLEERGDRAVALIRNSGSRNGETLDSLQTLFLTITDGHVSGIRVAVDDPEAVEAFWTD